MATKVMYITARVEYETDGTFDDRTIFSELDYNFSVGLEGVEITDTELTDYEIV